MKRLLFAAPLLFALTLAAVPANAGVGFGADVVNRYVWRGTDFGNAVSIQPGMSISHGNIEIGAWSSWAISGGGANENDLYASFSSGPIGITLTDYYFPGLTEDDDFFSYNNYSAEELEEDKDGDGELDKSNPHILEISASLAPDGVPLSALVAYNFFGDTDNSFWAEATYDLGEIEETAVSVTAGLGNGVYTYELDEDPEDDKAPEDTIDLVTVGLNMSKGDYFASYILNPNRESTFLVFGRSF